MSIKFVVYCIYVLFHTLSVLGTSITAPLASCPFRNLYYCASRTLSVPNRFECGIC
jgi:hypothetical protein